MKDLQNLLSLDVQCLLTIRVLLFSLFSLTAAYALVYFVNSLFPPPRGGGIPRISWFQLFDVKTFSFFPLDKIISSVKTTSEKEGYQIAEHPYDPSFFVWDVDFAEHVIKNPSSFPPYILPEGPKWQSILSSNFVVGDRKKWRVARQVVSPLLRSAWNPSVFHSATKRLLKRIETHSDATDSFKIFERSVSEVIYKIIYGVEPEPDFFEPGHEGWAFLDELKVVIEFNGEADAWLTPKILDPDFLAKKRRLNDANERLLGYVEMKKEALLKSIPTYSQPGNETELFPRLLEACDNGLLHRNSIFMDAVFLFAAGQVSTASLTHITLYQLARNQKLQDAIRKEIEEKVAVEIPESIEDVQELKLCKAALDETLRVAPPLAFTFGYESMETCTIGANGIIPPGSILNFCIADIHRNPKYFEDPNEYDPYRWLTEDKEKMARMKKAFMPFGFGGPMCPGRVMSKSESLTMLVAVLKKFNVKLSSENKFKVGEEPFNKISSIGINGSGLYLVFEKRYV